MVAVRRTLDRPYVVGNGSLEPSEPTTVDRGSSRRIVYHAVKPAHIRLTHRRRGYRPPLLAKWPRR